MNVRSALLLGVLLSACSERDPFPDAKQRYTTLLTEGRSPKHADFDAVLADLKSVKPGSKSWAEAQGLKQAIERARGASVGAPLAVAPTVLPQVEPELESQRLELQKTREACAQLAEALGTLAPDARPETQKRLDECRRRAQMLDEALAHGEKAK